MLPFRLGLCMAGSISAGAYTAGVLDALYEALEKWEDVRKGGLEKHIPQHRVVIDVFSGASGGGMCGVISALSLQDSNRYIGHHSSRLYHAWVEMNDAGSSTTLQQMLGNSDTKAGREVRSILDSSFIDHIADRNLETNNFTCRNSNCRPWLSQDLDIVVTASNLRGLSYNVNFRGTSASQQHMMTNHKLLLKFSTDQKYRPATQKITTKSADGKETITTRNVYPTDVMFVDFKSGFNIKRLKNAAKITGAFPFGLAPRNLEIEKELMENILFNKTELIHIDDKTSCKKTTASKNLPEWGTANYPEYETVCVDGGMTNNEPFEITRQILLQKGVPRDNMPREAALADRAILMVDPFPDTNIFEANFSKPRNLPDLAKKILKVLMNQPLFKTEDIELAQEDDVFSRFLIIPTRHDNYAAKPIACGTLGGFGGFFKKSFREHDFRLGRYNCRRFLLYHFGLPEEVAETNPVFKGCWTEEAKQKWRYYDQFRGKWMLPFIPILDLNEDDNIDSAKDKNLAKIPYPDYSEKELKALRPLIWKRVFTVMKNLAHHHVKRQVKNNNPVKKPIAIGIYLVLLFYGILLSPFILLGAFPTYLYLRYAILQKITHVIRENFTVYKLMKP
jgi:hypothetical protein